MIIIDYFTLHIVFRIMTFYLTCKSYSCWIMTIRPQTIRRSMDQKKEDPPMNRKSSLLNLNKEEAHKQVEAHKEVEAQQEGLLKKSSSTRINCLCSPTTHIGSFRCRLHRNGNKSGFRRGYSVGADLSEMDKSNSKSSLSSSTMQMHWQKKA